MALQIDNPEVDRLAAELADLTGEPIDQAVVEALREQLEKQKKIARELAAIHEIQRRFASLPVLDDRTDDEIIGYDENGLPT